MLPTYVIRTPWPSATSRASSYMRLTLLSGLENSNSSFAVLPKRLVLYSMNGPMFTPAIAHMPTLASLLIQPNWMSFATSITATGTP